MRGGSRKNSGRKKGYSAKNAEEARRVFSVMIMKEIKPIAEALIAKAKQGDIAAAKELFDRAFGKSSQNLDITSDNQSISRPPMSITYIVPKGAEKTTT